MTLRWLAIWAALTAAVAAALPTVACTGSSTRLPANQCAAWVAWYDGAGMANGTCCVATRTDPCACVGNNPGYPHPVCNVGGTTVINLWVRSLADCSLAASPPTTSQPPPRLPPPPSQPSQPSRPAPHAAHPAGPPPTRHSLPPTPDPRPVRTHTPCMPAPAPPCTGCCSGARCGAASPARSSPSRTYFPSMWRPTASRAPCRLPYHRWAAAGPSSAASPWPGTICPARCPRCRAPWHSATCSTTRAAGRIASRARGRRVRRPHAGSSTARATFPSLTRTAPRQRSCYPPT